VKVAEVDKGKAIGQGGANVRRASLLIKRYFEVDQVKIV
jgi:transcription antitermination factor NusA-like protein